MCINWDTVDRMSDSKTWCLSWLSINEDYHCDILKSVAWWHWWVDVKKRGRRRIVLAREREGKQRSNPLMDLSQKHTCSNRHRQKYVQRKIVRFSNWHVFGCQGLGTQTTHKGYLEFKLILICKSRNSLTNVNLPLTFSLQDWCKKKWKTGAKIENTSIRT